MGRRTVVDLSAWPSLSLEGNLIAPAMVAAVERREAEEQSEESYGLRKGLTLRDEISQAFRVGQSHFDSFQKAQAPSAEATCRFVRGFLQETFGFGDLAPGEGPVAFVAGGRVPVVVVPPSDERLDRRSVTLSTERARSPAFALQDFLNEREEALWGLVTNGSQLRLMRDNASLTRPAYIEADLAQIFANEDAASFAVLWMLIHRSRFGVAGAPATDCPLERWRDAGTREGVVARDRMAEQVQRSLELLGTGFLEANPTLAARVQSGEISLTEWFNELLRLVYRLIFLMVAEDRNLLLRGDASAEARRLYGEGYSLTALRAQCYRAATWDRHHDRYEGLKVVFDALARGEPRLGLPALGGLFASDRLPHLGLATLPNRALMEAIYRLSWLADGGNTVPVNWRAMETEELGSVYESLLELQPQLGGDGRSLQFASETSEKKGNQRKTTGSYYTPDSLVQALLDTALDPVLDRTEAEASDPASALLQLSVVDPACGSGHFLLAAARRIATRVARIRSEGTPSLEDFRHALRDVARSCLYGVDRNPMAVELTKVALWIETVDPGLPLGYFDAQIRCGDSLLGVLDLKVLEDGVPDEAFKVLTGDDRATARYYLEANRNARKGQGEFDFGTGAGSMAGARPLAHDFSGFRALPEDTVEAVSDKAARFASLREAEGFRRRATAADLYVAAFLLPKVGGAPAGASGRRVPTTEEVRLMLNEGQLRPAMTDAPAAARRARAFHWPLEFPDIMARGGFDVVLGNPPWEVMQLGEEEYFALRRPEIAELSGAARKRAIAALETEDPRLFALFAHDKRAFEAANAFSRASGRFPLTARGKLNTYSLFAELFSALSNLRAGVIVPTGIATDATTAPFFAHLVEARRLAQLVDFENSKPLFPGVHRSFKFALLTLGKDESAARFAFFLTDPAQLADPERNFTLTPEAIAAINPNTKTAPVFRSRADAELTAKIYARVPVLVEEGRGEEGNPWGVEFRQGLFNMTSDSHLFRTAAQLLEGGFVRDGADWAMGGERFVPLYEAKMIHQYDHRWAGYADNGSDTVDVAVEQKADPGFEPSPRYWVPEGEVEGRLALNRWGRRWLIGLRGITNATNERTVVAGLWPFSGVGNSCHVWMLDGQGGTPNPIPIYGMICSMVYDYVARQKVGGTNLNFFYVEQFPVLPPDRFSDNSFAFLTPRVLELTYTSHAMTPFARDLGYEGPPFGWDEDRRAGLRAELDAFYARAYGLTRDELRYILDPADVKGPDYPSETFRVLKDKEVRRFGEYRTQRLVLAAWDRFEADGTFESLEM
jgi:hypothetical protein